MIARIITSIATFRCPPPLLMLPLQPEPLKKRGQPVDLHPQLDWGRLLGQHVEIRQAGHFVRSGIVDAVMPTVASARAVVRVAD